MKITFLFGGTAMDAEHAPLAEVYLKKVSNYFPAEMDFVSSKERDEQKIKADMSSRIHARLKKCDAVVLFDERGKEITSSGYARALEKFIQGGRKHVGIMIGGAYGVDQDIFERASVVIRFSSMVFPHQLARVIALEQTYRALDIIRGGKYHHE